MLQPARVSHDQREHLQVPAGVAPLRPRVPLQVRGRVLQTEQEGVHAGGGLGQTGRERGPAERHSGGNVDVSPSRCTRIVQMRHVLKR